MVAIGEDVRRAASLRDRVEELEEEVRQLRDLLNPPRGLPLAWGLTPMQQRVVLAIARGNGSPVSRERIAASIYGGHDYAADTKIVDVYLCQIARRRDRHGLTIGNVHGTGRFMSPEDCRRVRDHLAGCADAAQPEGGR